MPFVVVVYPGAVYDDAEPASFRLPSADFLHPQLFAAKGYGVLLPSMPMPDGPRYGDDGSPQAGQVLRIMQVERGYAAQGGPPWKRLESYLHNSPVLRADKVETPLMLVHGDMDFVPIQQDEEFFTSLYRQDKRCRFVRYHGESHTVALRPNVLDLWSRIEAWLGEFLGGAGEGSATSVNPRGE